MSKAQNESLRSTIRAKGQITLPNAIRRKLNLEEGDELLITEQDGQVILTPAALVPRDQLGFWSEDWQAAERRTSERIASGQEGTFYASDDEFLSALERAVEDPESL